MFPGTHLSSFIKIGSVTAEIMLTGSTTTIKLKQWQQWQQQQQQCMTYYWPNFDQTLKLGLCDQQW